MTKLPTVPQLANVWQLCVRTSRTNAEEPHLSAKEFGQLKYLLKIAGGETSNVLRWSVENWTRFAQRATVEAGLWSAPRRPHIGFLLAHHDTAINMMATEVPEQVAELMKKAQEAYQEALAEESNVL